MQKVEAHQQKLEDLLSDADRALALGNDFADKAAIEGAKLHPQPSSGEESMTKHAWDLAKLTSLAVGKVLPAWPSIAMIGQGKILMRPPEEHHDAEEHPPPSWPEEKEQHKQQPLHAVTMVAGSIIYSIGSLITSIWRQVKRDTSGPMQWAPAV